MISRNSGRAAVFFLAVLFLLCIPASAYSEEAVRAFDEGNALLQAKDYSGAIGAYDRAISLEPGYFEAWNGRSDALNRAGELTEALVASSKALEINPDYVQGWINRGQILYNIGYYYEDQMGNFEKADEYYLEQILAFEQAVRLDPGNAEAHFNKGYALAGMKRYDEAIAAFDTVQALDPDYPNLALSQNQARVLRDATTPVIVRYAIPLAGIILLVVIVGGIFLWRRTCTVNSDEPVLENRRARRKKED